MKAKILCLCAVGALVACVSNAQTSPWYVNGEAGVSLPQNFGLRSAGVELDTKMNPGVRGGISGGYNFSDQFAGELETGVIWNSVDSLSGVSLSRVGANIDVYQIPILANLIYKTPVKDGFSGYLGAGAGGVTTLFDVRQAGQDENDSDFTFAYQGLAGIKYQIASNMDVGLGYKFLGTLDHHWTLGGSGFSTTALYTHSIMATFTFRF